jgi:hypothetical protein
MKNVKVLERAMTRQELLEYIKKHPKWKIPTIEECKNIELNEDRNFRVNDGTVAVSMLYAEGEISSPVRINDLIKMDVVLIQSLESCIDTGTVLYVKHNDEKNLQVANLEYERLYSRETLQKCNTDFLNSVINAMNSNDFVIFVKTNKRSKV